MQWQNFDANAKNNTQNTKINLDDFMNELGNYMQSNGNNNNNNNNNDIKTPNGNNLQSYHINKNHNSQNNPHNGYSYNQNLHNNFSNPQASNFANQAEFANNTSQSNYNGNSGYYPNALYSVNNNNTSLGKANHISSNANYTFANNNNIHNVNNNTHNLQIKNVDKLNNIFFNMGGGVEYVNNNNQNNFYPNANMNNNIINNNYKINSPNNQEDEFEEVVEEEHKSDIQNTNNSNANNSGNIQNMIYTNNTNKASNIVNYAETHMKLNYNGYKSSINDKLINQNISNNIISTPTSTNIVDHLSSLNNYGSSSISMNSKVDITNLLSNHIDFHLNNIKSSNHDKGDLNDSFTLVEESEQDVKTNSANKNATDQINNISNCNNMNHNKPEANNEPIASFNSNKLMQPLDNQKKLDIHDLFDDLDFKEVKEANNTDYNHAKQANNPEFIINDNINENINRNNFNNNFNMHEKEKEIKDIRNDSFENMEFSEVPDEENGSENKGYSNNNPKHHNVINPNSEQNFTNVNHKTIIETPIQAPPVLNLVSNLELAMKNKHKIVNVSPDDFLNNFQKEIHIEASDDKKALEQVTGVSNEDDEFDEEGEDNKNLNDLDQARNTDVDKIEDIASQLGHLTYQPELSFVERIFNKNFENEKHKEKFFENITRLLISFLEELQKHEKLLNQLKAFFSKDGLEINAELFENSRKLNNFFNGIIRLLIFFNRLESLNNKVNENIKSLRIEFQETVSQNISTNSGFIIEIKKIVKKIKAHFLYFETCQALGFNKIIEFETLKNLEISELFQLDLKAQEKPRCQICLHCLDLDSHTKLFSGDFHIACINYWINVIDNNSPFN